MSGKDELNFAYEKTMLLEKELQDKDEELFRRNEALSARYQKLVDAHAEIDELHDEILEIQMERDNLQVQLIKLDTKLYTSQKDVYQLTDSNEQLKHELINANTCIHEKEKELSRVETEYQRTQDEQSQSIEKLKSQNKDLLTQIDILQKELGQSKNIITSPSEQQSRIIELESNQITLEKELKTALHTISSLQTTLQWKQTTSDTEHLKIRNERDHLKGELAKLDSMAKCMHNDLETLQHVLHSLKKQLREKGDEVIVHTTRIVELDVLVAEANQRALFTGASMDRIITEFQNERVDYTTRITKLEKALDKSQKEVYVLMRDIAPGSAAQLEIENADLEKKLTSAHNEIDDLNKRIADMKIAQKFALTS